MTWVFFSANSTPLHKSLLPGDRRLIVVVEFTSHSVHDETNDGYHSDERRRKLGWCTVSPTTNWQDLDIKVCQVLQVGRLRTRCALCILSPDFTNLLSQLNVVWNCDWNFSLLRLLITFTLQDYCRKIDQLNGFGLSPLSAVSSYCVEDITRDMSNKQPFDQLPYDVITESSCDVIAVKIAGKS